MIVSKMITANIRYVDHGTVKVYSISCSAFILAPYNDILVIVLLGKTILNK